MRRCKTTCRKHKSKQNPIKREHKEPNGKDVENSKQIIYRRCFHKCLNFLFKSCAVCLFKKFQKEIGLVTWRGDFLGATLNYRYQVYNRLQITVWLQLPLPRPSGDGLWFQVECFDCFDHSMNT
uniref:Uncharacterized protein n=1 Tax=Cacopsylla melanoneura TaxID=428564 RepID=A0A8D9BGY4_9HEMI